MMDWAVGVAVALATLAAIWFGGRKSGISAVKSKQNEARLEAAQRAQEVENEVEALDRDTLKRRARRWVRGPKG